MRQAYIVIIERDIGDYEDPESFAYFVVDKFKLTQHFQTQNSRPFRAFSIPDWKEVISCDTNPVFKE